MLTFGSAAKEEDEIIINIQWKQREEELSDKKTSLVFTETQFVLLFSC